MSSDNIQPDIVLPFAARPRRPRSLRPVIALGLLFVLFLFFHNATPLYTDWLWFNEVGYTNVFTATIWAKTLLFAVFGALFFAIFYGNVAIARRLAPDAADRFLMERFGTEWTKRIQKYLGWILLGGALFLSLWAGRLAAESWADWLTFAHARPFHMSDPVFGNDVSFYIFRLPFLNTLYTFLIGALLITALAVVFIHVADRAIESWAGLPNLRPGVRAQLLALLAALALTQAYGTRLGAYDLLQSENGLFSGAGFTDLHYRLFAINVQCGLLLLTAIACLVSIPRGRHFRMPTLAVAAWLAAMILLGNIVPGVVQKVTVEPNQFAMERPYIERNIRYTRQGFGLQDVRSVDNFPADESLNAAQLTANRATLDNVRIWDHKYLGKVYAQLQAIKPYYKFERIAVGGDKSIDIDIDRYELNGKLRQVMLAPRELDSTALPDAAQTWQNRYLAYTHGYGLVMSPVNRTVAGDPDYFISGFPPVGHEEAASLRVTRPEIYYGQLAHEHIYVDTQQQEFDYPSTDSAAANSASSTQDHYATYQGAGGIRIGDSYLRKLAFAARLNDWNLMLANNLKPETRILFRRDIRERLMTVAPFVQQDSDPYLVVNPADGRLIWIVDCYTMSDRYPYSTPQQMQVNTVSYIAPNYIRNSIKATVDAYDGKINLYIADPNDPIAQTWASIYPGLFKPLSQLPAGLSAHLRYPEDLFRLQRSVYATYHVDDPRVFYLKEDVWAVPTEPNPDGDPNNAASQMDPYYVIMKLPDLNPQISQISQISRSNQESASLAPNIQTPERPTPGVPKSLWGAKRPTPNAEEFLLMSPLAPIKREDQNILGWMCARCDPAHYGELVLYRFPQQASVLGPSQVVQRINSDKVISPKLSLLRSGGSSATLGNLLVIPIEKSLLYIAPLYVEATGTAGRLPKLQQVVVAFGDNVAMDDTLDKALAQLFPGYGSGSAAPTPAASTPAQPQAQNGSSRVPPQIRALIERAETQYEGAQQKLKQGDFAGYGEATRQLKETLEALRRQTGSMP
jgi:uncharacterized membrane protein (UPF0182 family)